MRCLVVSTYANLVNRDQFLIPAKQTTTRTDHAARDEGNFPFTPRDLGALGCTSDNVIDLLFE